jgi:hypothetical protein
LYAKSNDTLLAYQEMSQLLTLDKEDAQTYLLSEGFTQEETTEILENTHCEPPESFIIVSEDMVGKAGVWSHFGLWDFEKAYMYDTYLNTANQQEFSKQVTQKLSIDEVTATTYYLELDQLPNRQAANQWISPYPGYAGMRSCTRNTEQITCNLGIQVGQQQGTTIVANQLIVPLDDPSNSTVTLAAQGQVIAESKPTSIVVDGQEYTNSEGDFSLSMNIKENRVVIAQPELTQSLFTELFFFENEGEYFTELTRAQQITGGKIIIYEVNWDQV